jgi:spermidine synthase
MACMAAELTAVRVQAPHFGDSAYVWTNVIGVILAALAVGAWLGGRLSGRESAGIWLVGLLATAGGLLGLAPFVAGPLGDWLLPGELPLDAAMPAIVRGSLVATIVLFAPPLLLLGAATPMLVTRLAAQGVPVGKAAGGVSAAGTLGSLAGTFAATHWLVPAFGCRVSMALAGGVLLLAAALVAAPRARAAAGVLMLLVVASTFGHRGPLREALPGRELLAERETRYQFLQVVRETTESGRSRTLLVINEGLDSFHSVAIEGSSFTDGAYYDWHALVPHLAAGAGRTRELRALSIGDAAGSLRAVFAAVHPGLQVDAVDIDPTTMELGDLHFRNDKASGARYAVDGRVFVEQSKQRWHTIHVDAYAHQAYVPAHLASREFFACCRERLEDGGVLACNVGGLHADDPVLRAIGTTVASVFGHARAIQVPRTRNFLIVARRGSVPGPAELPSALVGEERLTAADAEHWLGILQSARDPQRWHDVGSGGELLVDDRPVLDELLHGSYLLQRDSGSATACAGRSEPSAAEILAHAAAQRQDWHAVLLAVGSSHTPTAYLRELAGDARWWLRELHGASAEYDAALSLAEEPLVRERLAGKVAQLTADRRPQQRAEAVAERNGWLVAVSLGLAVAGALLLCRAT